LRRSSRPTHLADTPSVTQTESIPATIEQAEQPPRVSLAPLAVRGGVGGVLMGLANLVPGISGGTMLLAAGVYPRFIAAIGEVTTFKFRKVSLVVLLSVVAAAGLAIVGLAGPVKALVVEHRWVMYSLFIGLTLGGVPVVWRLIKQPSAGMWTGAAFGFLGMAALAYVQQQGGGGADREGFVFMLLAGAAGASAMILPGVSGGYLLLVLGVYVPILGGISAFKDAVFETRDMSVIMDVGLSVILPVGLGVLLGVVAVSNLLKWLLEKYEKPTLGALLGLLLGAVVGLYPFVEGVRPEPGDTLKGQTLVLDKVEGESTLVYEQTRKVVEADDYPIHLFTPTATQIAGALGLILGGFAVTMLVDRIGSEKETQA